jgi:hypothetical protein
MRTPRFRGVSRCAYGTGYVQCRTYDKVILTRSRYQASLSKTRVEKIQTPSICGFRVSRMHLCQSSSHRTTDRFRWSNFTQACCLKGNKEGLVYEDSKHCLYKLSIAAWPKSILPTVPLILDLGSFMFVVRISHINWGIIHGIATHDEAS